MIEAQLERQTSSEDSSLNVRGLVLDVIQSRRSIREGFTDKPIPNEVISEIIKSGLVVPFFKNAQPWRLHVVHRGELLNSIADDAQNAKDAKRYVPINPATGVSHQWPSIVVEPSRVLREVGVGLFIENIGAAEPEIQTRPAMGGDLIGIVALGYSEHETIDKQLRLDTVVFYNSNEGEA